MEGLESTASSLEGVAPQAAPASGAPVLEEEAGAGSPAGQRCSGLPVLAWPHPRGRAPCQPSRQKGLPHLPHTPGGKLKKKSGGPSGLDLYDSCAQKAAILKRGRK